MKCIHFSFFFGVTVFTSIPKYVDGSRFRRQSNDSEDCQFPENPPHGQYRFIGNDSSAYPPGKSVPQFGIVVLNCDPTYTNPANSKTFVCSNREWSPKLSGCYRTCPTLTSTESTLFTCSFEKTYMETCDDPLEGTVATPNCAEYYQNVIDNAFYVCRNGQWSGLVQQCVPICGEKRPEGATNIINGINVVKGDYPWHVAIYTADKGYICGGSIISQRIVITAAHCLSAESDGTPLPKDNYLVAAGKYYRQYDDPRDQHPQYPMIEAIHIPTEYRGGQLQHEFDIAVIILTKDLILTDVVQSICVDWLGSFETEQLYPNNLGVVTGWGFTMEGKNLSIELKELSVPYIPWDQCRRAVPRNFKKFARPTKICGGYLNRGTAVCGGDSGGGLAFPNLATNKYFLRGIVSVSPAIGKNVLVCDSNQYGLYTKLSEHLEFVKRVYVQNLGISQQLPTATSEKKCYVPENPLHGKFVIIDNDGKEIDKLSGNQVPNYGLLSIKCDQYYSRSSASGISVCADGKWNPDPGACFASCTPLTSTKSTTFTCSFNKTDLKTCGNPLEGTTATPICKQYYERYNDDFIVCSNGKWIGLIQQCVPICGKKRSVGVTNETSVVKGNYPWHVGIYQTDKKYICAGSIIHQRIILTAAHCVSNSSDGSPNPKENYLVAAGKYYRQYDDSRDQYPQYQLLQIETIHIPQSYRGPLWQYQSDIAVIALAEDLVLTDVVQPICVDWTNKFEFEQLIPNNLGVLTGWGSPPHPQQNLSSELKEFSVPYISFDQCFNEVPRYFRKFIHTDKFCGGFFNNETSNVCEVASGEGWAFAHLDTNKYFLRGIFSLSSSTGDDTCPYNHYSLFTHLSKHLEFVKLLYVFNSSAPTPSDECRIPEKPPHGEFVIVDNEGNVINGPDNQAPLYSILSIKCEQYYNHSSALGLSVCGAGRWHPDPDSCNEYSHSVPSSEVPSLTTIAEHSFDADGDVCGMVDDSISSDDNAANKKDHPWLATLFEYIGVLDIIYRCGATLITKKHALTSVSCVTKDVLNRYSLVIGKTDIKQNNYEQVPIIDIRVSVGLQGNTTSFYANIAILKLSREIGFTPMIRPICLWKMDSNQQKVIGLTGVVPSWPKVEYGPFPESEIALANSNFTIVSEQECLKTNFPFPNLVSNATFCAGYPKSDCERINGNGFYMKMNGRWFLRGIAFYSVVMDNCAQCDSNHFLRFLDVDRFRDWILVNLNFD